MKEEVWKKKAYSVAALLLAFVMSLVMLSVVAMIFTKLDVISVLTSMLPR